MWKVRYFNLLLLLLPYLLVGCMTMHPDQQMSKDYIAASSKYHDKEVEVDKQISENLKFEDIPIPSGFNLVVRDSFVFNNDFTRVGIIEYIGPGHINAVTTFFKKQMPLFNWELINSIEYSKSVISFEKNGQTCIVIVEQQSKNRTLFTIASGPRK